MAKKMKKFDQRKYNWPDDPKTISDLDDTVLLKLWRYAPPAKTEHEIKCSQVLCNEIVDRNLESQV